MKKIVGNYMKSNKHENRSQSLRAIHPRTEQTATKSKGWEHHTVETSLQSLQHVHRLVLGAAPAAASPQRTQQRSSSVRFRPNTHVHPEPPRTVWSEEGHLGHEAEPGSDLNPAQQDPDIIFICTCGMGVCDAKQYKVISCVLHKWTPIGY